MSGLIRDLIVSIGVLASLIGLVSVVRPPGAHWTALEIGLLILALLLGTVSVYFDITKYKSRPVKSLKSRREIRDYMYQWINNAGGVAIFSRDLSWVDDAEMESLLKSKATNNELTLVLPRPIELSERLEELGAHALYYPSINYVVRSRFTMVNIGRSDTRVAIGRTEGARHRIEEFSAGDNPTFYLADDMLELVSRFCNQDRRPPIAG